MPLSLNSSGSLCGLMLSDDEVLDPAKLPRPLGGFAWSFDCGAISSATEAEPLTTDGFLTNGLRKGGMMPDVILD